MAQRYNCFTFVPYLAIIDEGSLRFSERETISIFTTSGSSKSMNKGNIAYNIFHGEGQTHSVNSDVDSDVEAMATTKKSNNLGIKNDVEIKFVFLLPTI
jgi:hypothetical protein